MRTRETSNIALLDDHRPPAGRRSKADRAPAVDRLRSPNQLNDSGEASLVGAALGAVGRHAPLSHPIGAYRVGFDCMGRRHHEES